MSDVLFHKSLQDLVKGIRSHRRDASAFISQHMVEIKAELRSTDISIKAEAVSRYELPQNAIVFADCDVISR